MEDEEWEYIVEFTESLPDDWQTPIPQNVAAGHPSREYRWEYRNRISDYASIYYYINKPINDEFFLTVMALERTGETAVKAMLCEGSYVKSLLNTIRGPEKHIIEAERLDTPKKPDGDLESHFEEVSEIIEQFVEEYGEYDLGELKRISMFGEGGD